MKKILSILCLLILSAPYSYGATVLNGEIITNIPNTVKVTANSEIKTTTTINPENGTHTGLEAQFFIQTNATDQYFDFILSSKIETVSGAKNAYFQNNGSPYIMLGNITGAYPSLESYNDIANGILTSNPDIIAYPVLNSVSDTATITPTIYNNELCFAITIGTLQNIYVTQNVEGTPLGNTYTLKDDRTGTYETVLTLNAISKP